MKTNEILDAIINITWQTKEGIRIGRGSVYQRERERDAIRQLFDVLSLPTPDDGTCNSCYPW